MQTLTYPTDKKTLWKVIVASSAGTLINWYDFFVYGALATLIAGHFFQKSLSEKAKIRKIRLIRGAKIFIFSSICHSQTDGLKVRSPIFRRPRRTIRRSPSCSLWQLLPPVSLSARLAPSSSATLVISLDANIHFSSAHGRSHFLHRAVA